MTDHTPAYTCAYCGETYTKVCTDDEAIKEFKENFPEHVVEKLAIVCDDCYKSILSLVGIGTP